MSLQIDLGAQWTHWMMRGDFERAWQVSDRISGAQRLQELFGKRLLVRCEHGLGDTIQFIRYLPLLRPLVRSILVHVQPRLLAIVRALPEIDSAFTWDEAWPHGGYDCEVEIMELPYLFRTTLDTVPHDVPYLSIDVGLGFASRAAFQRDGHLNVGVQWRAGGWDVRRSVPSEALSPLRTLPGVALFSLEALPEAPDVVSTAAAIQNLDLIVSADTMAAHLAGALGKPVWVLLPHEANWRWMIGRDDSPWYPTMRLFRQGASGDWSGVVDRVAGELLEQASAYKKAAPAA